MTSTTESVTQAGSGANNPGSLGPSSLPCDSPGGAEAVAAPPAPDDSPGSAGADEIKRRQVDMYCVAMAHEAKLSDPGGGAHFTNPGFQLDEILEFDLEPLPDDDSDPHAFPRSRRLICSTSSDGQTTFHRFGETGLVLTAEETLQAYEFLANTATVWRQAL